MKQLTLLIFFLCYVLTLQAQVTKSVTTTQGNLINALSAGELNSITDLTITGTLDARDFKLMRDNMPMLQVLDIGNITINAYEGIEGTYYMDGIPDLYHFYPAHEIPMMSFFDRSSLQSIIFPLSCQSIGSSAFSRCSGLTGELNLPSTIRSIGDNAFGYCTGLTGDLIIPPLVTLIENHTFLGCTGFTSLTIHPSVKEIKYGAFNGCSGLQYIDVQSPLPVPLIEASVVFDNIDKTTCELRVPYATRDLYASAPVWRDFVQITEHEQGLLLSATSLRFENDGGTNSSIQLKANVEWSAHSDQSWLSVNPISGNNDQTITIMVEANPTIAGRQATITFSSEGIESQLIQVTQNGIPNTITISAGGLSKALTAEEKSKLSYLVLSGSMDARDFKTIHDQLPMLETLDISAVTIEAYTDTTYGRHNTYKANTIPAAIWEWTDVIQTDYSLSGHPRLSVVKLPASMTTIGYRAFYNCPKLSTVELQSSVESINDEAFSYCTSLISINLPASVTHIGEYAFEKCSLSSIVLPPALTAISSATFYECSYLTAIDIPISVTSIGGAAFYGCSKLQSIVIPPKVTTINGEVFYNCNSLSSVIMPPGINSIGPWAFQNCTSLTSINIPKWVTHIDFAAFFGCKNLQSIYALPDPPVDLLASDSWGVFDHIDKSGCILYVPFGTKELYANSYAWKDFLNIVEMTAFSFSDDSLTIAPTQGSVTVELTTELTWTASSDQPWLTVTPASGSGNMKLTLNAEANPTVDHRTARVIFHTNADTSPEIMVLQKGNPVTVEVAAGKLSEAFDDTELRKVNSLILSGTMDARDFKFIRDQLPSVSQLDLSRVTIVAYSGNEGTYLIDYSQGGFYNYPADEIPPSAFERYSTNLRIDYPSTVTSIGARAFYGCSKLTETTIPSSVTSIGAYAFGACLNLTTVTLPPALIIIEDNLFEGCSNLTSLTIPSTVTTIGKYAFLVCDKLTFLEIPDSVTSIGEHAFEACYKLNTVTLPAFLDSIKDETFNSSGLTTISIPASVKYIGTGAFRACYLLTEMYAYSINPPALAASEVFAYFDKTMCTLYVPYGSKEKYAVADQWKDFVHIVEMEQFSLSDATLNLEAKENSSATLQLISSFSWNASCSQEWLTVSPASGNSGQQITFTAKNNPLDSARTAVVSVLANGIDTLTLTVIQKGVTVGLEDDMAENTEIKYFPNPFSTEMAIDIANPSRKEVSVDIYSISGQKIRSLARAQKGTKISLQWNGTDEQGKKVPEGIYLLKMGKESVKIIKR